MIDECAIVAIIDGDIRTREALQIPLERAGISGQLFEDIYLRTSDPHSSNCILLDPGHRGDNLRQFGKHADR